MTSITKPLEKDIYAGIVTSLHFYNSDILLAGHGPYLKVYNVKTGRLLCNEEALPHHRIHRIVPVPNTSIFAIYGSKYISVIKLTIADDSASIKVVNAYGPFRDWIMDVQWLQESCLEIAIAYAHNFVEIYNIDTCTPTLLSSIQCQVRCILYAARFFGHTRSTLRLASGTVFNEVLVWNMKGEVTVLKGHEGVIFGVRFNDDGTRLSSVSDDRTIRIWSLEEEGKPLVLYGHTARIWDCQFVDDYLVSISEDATCRVWKGEDCIACWEGHVGKNVFSCAINTDHGIVATGGQDSGIRLWSLLSVKNNKIDSEEDLTSYPLDVENDYVRNFVLVKDHIIGATTQGYIVKCDTKQLPYEWTQIQYDPTYRNYAIMTSSECGRIVVIGNILGGLIIISPDDRFEPIRIAAHKQKLFEIFIEQGIDEHVLYIISNGYNDCVLFHKLDLSNPCLPTIQTLYDLEMPIERTTLLSVALAEKENVLICGSRESALLIYRLPTENISTLKPSLQLRRTHGRQAITHILIDKTIQNGLFFWTTGRDGCYIQYRLDTLNTDGVVSETQLGVASRGDTITSSHDMVLEKLYRNKVTKGTLERAILVDGQLLLCGFLRNHFFVYNEHKHFCIVSINCGGGHRRWQFRTQDAKLNQSCFAFIRKEVLYTYLRAESSESYKDSILQHNYHGRDVRAVHFIRMGDGIVFATGGEDTMLRLQQYLSTSDYSTLSTIRKHASVIKNISTSQGIASLLFTSGGLEELLCWKLENTTTGLHCLEWATCPTISQDIETRIMDTAVYLMDTGLHLVGAVYSDATVRFWLFNETTRKFSLVADGAWHAKCILQMAHIVINDHVLFITSATDGKVALWDIGDALEDVGHVDLELEPTKAAFRLDKPTLYYTTHMSGVNALAVVPFRDDCHLAIITGGDDNAVTISLIKVQKEGITQVGDPFIIASAHASSVTGIIVLNDTVFSISTDQRLNRWKLKDEGDEGVSLHFQDMIFIDVPDPSALDAILYNDTVHIAISGVGLQTIKTLL